MTRRSALRMRQFITFALVYGVIGFFWQLIEEGSVNGFGFGIGVSVGIALAAFENSRLVSFTRSMSFTAAILAKSFIYLVVIAVPIMILGLLGGFLRGLTIADYFAWIFSAEFPRQLVIIYMIHLVVVFFRHLNRLLGPGTLLRYVSGTYHRPRIERRVFMFLDLKGSTTLAERLGSVRYFAFLNRFFRDISEPVLEYEAEIYQYVGDEVVLTWPVGRGIRNANCVRIFFAMVAAIDARKDRYLAEFGHVPEFKAGLHFGDVVTAEIGDIKKEIVYSGDVLNTAARIQSVCNQYGRRLIASESILSTLALPDFVHRQALGEVELRGKADTVSLVGLA